MKSEESQKIRSILVARSRPVSIRRDIGNQVRSIPTEYGLLFTRAVSSRLRKQVLELVGKGNPLFAIIGPLFAIHLQVCTDQGKLDREVRRLARADETTKRLMTVPWVDGAAALTFRHTIDDPSRFSSATKVGAFRGLTPRRKQSGETDINPKIWRWGVVCCDPICLRQQACSSIEPKNGWP